MEAAFNYFRQTATTNAFISRRLGEPELISTEGAGFQLTACCIGADRGWIARTNAANAVLQLLTGFHALPRHHGFWAEYYDVQSLTPTNPTPLQPAITHTLSTASLAAGLHTARAWFNATDNETEPEIRRLCNELINTIEWPWMLNDSKGVPQSTLAAYALPEAAFPSDIRLTARQDFRGILAYLLAIASSAYPIDVSCWYEGWVDSLQWETAADGNRFFTCPALLHLLQPYVWIDLENRRDRVADYFSTAKTAIQANHAYAVNVLYPGSSFWGLTDCIGPSGYERYGFPPLTGPVEKDGVLCPPAAIASMPFTPEYAQEACNAMYTAFTNQIWGEYGFYEAFSPKNNWFHRGYTTVQQGILLGMLANTENGFVQKLFMSNPEISDAMDRIGFTGILDPQSDRTSGQAPRLTVEPSSIYSVTLSTIAPDEGHALQISYQKDGTSDTPLALIPFLKNFTPYRYLAFWFKGRSEPVLTLEDADGHSAALNRMIKGPARGDWRKCYYPLPVSEPGFDLSRIQRITLQAEPRNAKGRGIFYLNRLHLANVPAVEPPAAPERFHATPSRMPGELTLHWNMPLSPTQAHPVYRYHARYANTPIRDEHTFYRASVLPGTEIRPINGSAFARFTRLPPSLQPYYIALRTEDLHGNLSDITCSDPVTLNDRLPPSEFPLEHFDEEQAHLRWTSHSPALTALRTTEASLEGRGCLEISYRKETEADRWVCLTIQPDIHHLTPYRYLSMWVAGRADFVLRFIDANGNQQDTAIEHATNPNSWAPLFFDLSKLTDIDLSAVDRILLFVEPDKTHIAGVVYLDSITLSNTRN